MRNQYVLKSTFSLLNVDFIKLNKNWNYKNVISPFYRLYLIDGGTGIVYQKDHLVTLKKDHLYLIPSYTLCNYQCQDSLDQFYIHFIEESLHEVSLFPAQQKILEIAANEQDRYLFERILALNPGRELTRSHNPKDYQKQPVIDGYQAMNSQISIAALMETTGILFQLLSRFLTVENFQSPAHKHIPSKILDTLNYIATHLAENLSVAGLAARVNQNPDYFSRIFQDYTGLRPLGYIQQKRVERAQFLMLTSDLSFNEIAAETGFESLSYFSRTFKQITGQAPRNYYKNKQNV